MKKKTLLLSLTAGATALGVAALTLSNTSAFALYAGGRTHTVYLNSDNTTVQLGEYDSDNYLYPISFFGDDVIVVSQEEKYDLNSYNDADYTYLYGPQGTYSTKGSSLLSFTSAASETLTITFALKGATLDVDASFIAFIKDDDKETYNNSNTFDSLGSDAGFNYYFATASFNNAYGHKIDIIEIKLVFTCD